MNSFYFTVILGELLPYVEEDKSTCERGLYHHGEEPHRPGYTIEELYQLSRSSIPRQRITALNTLASILEKVISSYLYFSSSYNIFKINFGCCRNSSCLRAWTLSC